MTTKMNTLQDTHDLLPNVVQMSLPNLRVHWVLITGLVLILLTLHFAYVWKQRHLYRKSWSIPGPLPLPFIGSSYIFLGKSEDILNKLIALLESYNGFFKLWFGNTLVYFVTEPEQIEKVLNNSRTLEKGPLYKPISDTLGWVLMTAPVPQWKIHRKTIAPAFNQRILDSFVELFAEQSAVCAEILGNLKEKNQVDIYGIMTRLSLEVICETALGIKMDIQQSNGDFGETFDKILELICIKIFYPWYNSDFVWNLSSLSKIMRSKMNKFNSLTEKVIQEKKTALEHKQKQAELIANTEETPKRLAFLDLLMENSNFSNTEIRDEITMFLFAATDTSASTVTFLTIVFGMYPDIQQKVYDEVVDIMGRDRQPLPDDLPKMKYTERVIKETLRLFPAGVFFARAITEDTDVGNGVVLPKGCTVAFVSLYVHRNEKYWPDPLKFDPDRFLPEEVAKRHPCTHLAFSYGSRNCLGMRYAIMNLKVVIASLVRKVKFYSSYKSIGEIQLKAHTVLRLKDGAKLTVEPRED